LGQPRDVRSNDAAVDDLTVLHGDERRARRRDGAREPRFGVAGVRGHEGSTNATDERQKYDQRKEHGELSGDTLRAYKKR
jgi:hypothetical protein